MRNRAADQVTLVLIRHGETAANKERRYLGKTDESLSEAGIKALVSYKEQKRYPDVKYLFSSPMKRCLETAEILYPGLHPAVIPEWTEMDFGDFENKNYEELKSDARYQAWIDSGGTFAFPGGESRKAFILRCERGLERMCGELYRKMEPCADDAVRVGIIAHGGTIMALMSAQDGDYFNYQVANGSGYIGCMNGWRRSVQTGYGQRNQIRIEEAGKL